MKHILVTGGAGFIGSNFINYILKKQKDIFLVNLDKLTYAGNLENLRACEDNPNYIFVKGDICNVELVDYLFNNYSINHVFNFAAESHVDRSILGSEIFFRSNVMGTNVLLEASRRYCVERYIQISTDEVYGSLESSGKFTENSTLSPNSPYSVSKASGDLMALSFFNTYNLPIIVTRCSNNFGPFQFPEKLIPLMIINSLRDKKLPVYGDGLNIRDWIYVSDHNMALELIWQEGVVGEVYNIGSNNEMKNIDLVKLILKNLNKPEHLIEFVKDRPGHDKRYAIDSSKIMDKLGWKPKYSFEESIEYTIKWYLDNVSWWENIITGDYQKFYQKWYHSK
ncbi:dTDP-glucose 4,6-dehydratase [Bacteroidota bacterium]